MLNSVEEVSRKEKLNRENLTREAWKKQQQQQRRGVGGNLQEKFWDPRGFQQSWEAHEQDLMNFRSIGV
jgi:hypothetical protein